MSQRIRPHGGRGFENQCPLLRSRLWTSPRQTRKSNGRLKVDPKSRGGARATTVDDCSARSRSYPGEYATSPPQRKSDIRSDRKRSCTLPAIAHLAWPDMEPTVVLELTFAPEPTASRNRFPQHAEQGIASPWLTQLVQVEVRIFRISYFHHSFN